MINIAMHSCRQFTVKSGHGVFLRLVQAALSNATVIYNKLHPDESKGTKDIVEEVCEYYIEKFDSIIGKRHKCEAENCSV